MKKYVFATLITGVLVSCQPAKNDTPITETWKNYEMLRYETAPVLTKSQEDILASCNQYGFSLARKQLAKTGESFVYSPMSGTFLLGMLASGTAGKTIEEIYQAIGIKDATSDKLDQFCLDMEAIASQSKEVSFRVANAVVVDNQYQLLDTYIKRAREHYESLVVNLDFSDAENTLDYINGWVSDQTESFIPKMLERLDPQAFAYVVNALYFKGLWETPFLPEYTTTSDFYGDTGKRLVPTMQAVESFAYARTNMAQSVCLPYRGGYAMRILLPAEGNDLNTLLNELSNDSWTRQVKAEKVASVAISLPKFKVSSKTDFRDVLPTLGISSIFRPGADFSRMSDMGIVVNEMFQKAEIEVNENGTEAAAASAASLVETAEPVDAIEFRADHPFLFVITHEETGAVVFIGTIR